MKAFIAYRVELKLVKDGCVVLVTKLEVNNERSRVVDKALELFCVNSEKHVLCAVAIEVARNKSVATESLDGGFVANFAQLAVKYEMLHFLKKLKCVTQSDFSQTPLHQNPFGFSNAAQI